MSTTSTFPVLSDLDTALHEPCIEARAAILATDAALDAVEPAVLAAAEAVLSALEKGVSARLLASKGHRLVGTASRVTHLSLVGALYRLDGSDEVEAGPFDVLPLDLHRSLLTAANNGLRVPEVRAIIAAAADEDSPFVAAYDALTAAFKRVAAEAREARKAERKAAAAAAAAAAAEGEGGDESPAVEDGPLNLLTTALSHIKQALAAENLSAEAWAVAAEIAGVLDAC